MSHESATELLVPMRRGSTQWAYLMEAIHGLINSFSITPHHQDSEDWIRENTGPAAGSGMVVQAEECVL